MEIGDYSWSINRLLILTPAPFWARSVVPLGVCGAGDYFTAEVHYIAEDIGFINELGYQIIKTAMVNSDILVSVRR